MTGCYEHGKEPSGFKKAGNFLSAETLSVSGTFCSMQLDR
jgi:hypothetical protein